MPLPAGLELGGFEVVGLLGAGGMGEVYHARDRQLNRSVALKVLRSEVTSAPHRLVRFEQEARAASALSHPNICHVYHLGETPEGQRYIAMEYVDGETLADRLGAGPLPLTETLDVAIQLAAALTAAHCGGIVHRDLKPENVMVRRDGLAKLLDFGLAKLLPPAWPHAPHGPTQTAPSEPGSVVGTVHYMAPEQARGQAVDARADIWALGVVLYEMVAGRPPFMGSSRTDVLVAILDREPVPLATLDPRLPTELDRIVRKALRKDPERRYQVMKDLLLDLEALREEVEAANRGRASTADSGHEAAMQARVGLSDAAAAPARGDPRGHRLPMAARLAAALAIVGLGALTVWWTVARPARGDAGHTLDLMLDGLEVGVDTAPALSPDGRWVLYRAGGRLWRRALHDLESEPLPDSSGALYAFWSADGRQVAFVRDQRVWRLPLDAAHAIPVGDAPPGLSGSGAGVWTNDNELILAGSDTVGLFSTRIYDPRPREALPLNKDAEIDFHQVAPLPEGRGLLVAVHRLQGSDTIAAFVNGSRRDVLQLPGEVIQFPVYSPPGYLLFERWTTSQGIWGVRFSIDRLATEGAPFLVVPGGVAPSVGADGTLAFVRGWPPRSELVWIDGKGSIEPIGALEGPLGQGSGPMMALSPDERRVALSIDGTAGTELWSYDFSRGVTTRLSAGATRVTSPVWTPDGRHVLFGAFGRGRTWNVYSVPSDETREPARALPASSSFQWPCTISPDGRWLVYVEQQTGRATDLWIAPPHQRAAARRLTDTPHREDYARFSPDGRSIVYLSNESGRVEVYARAFPLGPERVQVSTNGGSMPSWSPDGREIVFRTPGALMAATVTRTRRGLVVSAPRQLFSVHPDARLLESFVVASHGRFLFAREMGRAYASVMLNWSRGVARLENAP